MFKQHEERKAKHLVPGKDVKPCKHSVFFNYWHDWAGNTEGHSSVVRFYLKNCREQQMFFVFVHNASK